MCVYIFTYPSIVCRPPGLQNNRPPERCGAERRPCLLRRAPPTLRSLGAEPHAAAGRELFRETDTADCRNPCCYYHLHHHVVELPVRTSARRYPSWLVSSPFLSGGCGSAETVVGWAGRPCRFALASTSRSPCNGSCGAAQLSSSPISLRPTQPKEIPACALSPLKADDFLVAIEYWNLLPKILRRRRPGDLPVPVGPYSVQRPLQNSRRKNFFYSLRRRKTFSWLRQCAHWLGLDFCNGRRLCFALSYTQYGDV